MPPALYLYKEYRTKRLLGYFCDVNILARNCMAHIDKNTV